MIKNILRCIFSLVCYKFLQGKWNEDIKFKKVKFPTAKVKFTCVHICMKISYKYEKLYKKHILFVFSD